MGGLAWVGSAFHLLAITCERLTLGIEEPSVPDKTALPRCHLDPAKHHCNLRASFLLSPLFHFFIFFFNQLNPFLENHIGKDSLLTAFKRERERKKKIPFLPIKRVSLSSTSCAAGPFCWDERSDLV